MNMLCWFVICMSVTAYLALGLFVSVCVVYVYGMYVPFYHSVSYALMMMMTYTKVPPFIKTTTIYIGQTQLGWTVIAVDYFMDFSSILFYGEECINIVNPGLFLKFSTEKFCKISVLWYNFNVFEIWFEKSI